MTLTEQAIRLNGKIENIVETSIAAALKGTIQYMEPEEFKMLKDTLDVLEEALKLNMSLCEKIENIDSKLDAIGNKK